MNETTQRFEVITDDETAYIDYRWYNEKLVLLYVFVPIPFRGKGISQALIKYSLDYAKSKDVKINVYCPYISKYIRTHPEYEYLLESEKVP